MLRLLFTTIAVARLVHAGHITWLSPTADEEYNAGDTIIAKWTSANGSPVASPSFRICQSAPQSRRSNSGDDDDGSSCGTAMWPSVQHSSDDTYLVSLAVPDAVNSSSSNGEASSYFLKMEDDFGQVSSSPKFGLKPGYAPKSDAASDSATPSATQFAEPSQATEPAQAPFALPATVPPQNNPMSTASPISSIVNAGETTKTTTPIAAIAVPLSIFGAILLVALAMAVKQRSDMKKDRQADLQRLNALEKLGDIEKGITRKGTIDSDRSSWSFPASAAAAHAPVPLFMPPTSVAPPGYATVVQPSTYAFPYAPSFAYCPPHSTAPAPPVPAGAREPPQIQIPIPSAKFNSPFSRASSQASRYSSVRATSRGHHVRSGYTTRQSSMRTAVPSRYPSTLSTRKRWPGRSDHFDDDSSATNSVIVDYLEEIDDAGPVPSPGHGHRAVSPGVLINKDMLFTETSARPPPVPDKDTIPASLRPRCSSGAV